MRVVLWTGPVASFQVKGATVPDARSVFFPCTGDGDPSCGQIAEGWTDSAGRRLPGMLRKAGATEGDELFMGAFSAGGSMCKRVLMDPRDRAPVRAVMLSDATYTDWAAPGRPLPPEGFVRYALDALAAPRDKLFVATASASPNKTLPSGSQTLAAMAAEIERRSGVPLSEGHALPGPKRPLRIWQAPGVVLADYGMGYAHAEHATALAPILWQELLTPWLEGVGSGGGGPRPGPLPVLPGGGREPLGSGSGIGGKALAIAGGFLVGYAAGHYLGRRG